MKNHPKIKNNNTSDNAKTWKMILLIFAGVNVGVIAFSWYLFSQISVGGIFSIKKDNTVSVETINRGLLSDTITSFERKKNSFERLKTTKPDVVDPSI